MNTWIFVFLILSVLYCTSESLIHHLTIDRDDRKLFKIETFGFNQGGVMELLITEMILDHPPGENKDQDKDLKMRVGFIMRRSASESAAQEDLEDILEKDICLLDTAEQDDVIIDLGQDDLWKHKSHIVHEIKSEDEAGLYTLLFARCTPTEAGHTISFKLDAMLKNPGHSLPGASSGPTWDYLSAGDQPLPIMYAIYFILFLTALITWIVVLRRDPQEYGTIHKIHYLMLTLLVLKCCTLLTQAIRYKMISASGTTNYMNIVYYIFTTMRGIMMFIVILLIGSGWSILKGFLHQREKQIVLFVLVAQIIINVAVVVLEETAPGSQQWIEWKDALHIFDLLCCIAILFPVIWNIRHLTAATRADGKDHRAQLTLIKLQVFRTFYIMVVTYIYFTRIIVYIVTATVQYHVIWLGPFSSEFATLVFYVATGVKFQPQLDNPYLTVTDLDEDVPPPLHDLDSEFGEVESDEEEIDNVELGSIR